LDEGIIDTIVSGGRVSFRRQWNMTLAAPVSDAPLAGTLRLEAGELARALIPKYN
jgi:hypothetical protein